MAKKTVIDVCYEDDVLDYIVIGDKELDGSGHID